MMKEFVYGDCKYPYQLILQERKSLSLTVYPDKRIIVKCPHKFSQDRLHQFLKRKYFWLKKQILFFDSAKRSVRKKEHVSGESFYYLGRQYKLMVKTGPVRGICLAKSSLVVTVCPDQPTEGQCERLLEAWYRQNVAQVLKERFSIGLDRCGQFSRARLKIQNMRTRWGSCSRSGTIMLNPKLVLAPIDCIDYVIMHELCHLIEHSHSPGYYKVLDRMMPDWKSRKKRLESIIL